MPSAFRHLAPLLLLAGCPAPFSVLGGADFCGDAVVDPGEECDDGNGLDSDDCTHECKLPTCGDGLLAPGEQCDDGPANDDAAACLPTCKLATCGDGHLGPGEQCDDGNKLDSDACTHQCKLPICGDGIVSSGEQCDDGPANGDTAACLSSCAEAACGDGHVEAGVELCDDGNADDTDACIACVPAACGDGLVHAGVEQCDDGNGDDTDDCVQCMLAACGDGSLHAGAEECDDGDKNDDDTCTNACEIPRRRVFVTHATYSGALGGLANADTMCTNAAASAGLNTKYSFKAWLATAQGADPVNRMDTEFTGHYVLTDGTIIATGWADLTDGTLNARINRSQLDDIVSGSVWTNVQPSGAAVGAAEDCSNWNTSSNTYYGRMGSTTASDGAWSDQGGSSLCNSSARLYCFEDP